MANVAPATASSPLINESSRIVVVELTKTFPSNIVHNRKLPRFRTGYIFFAYFLSSGEPASWITTKSCGVNDIKPRFKPEKRPERESKSTRQAMVAHTGIARRVTLNFNDGL